MITMMTSMTMMRKRACRSEVRRCQLGLGTGQLTSALAAKEEPSMMSEVTLGQGPKQEVPQQAKAGKRGKGGSCRWCRLLQLRGTDLRLAAAAAIRQR